MKQEASSIHSATLVTSENREALIRNKPLFFRLLVNILDRLTYGTLVLILPNGQALKFASEQGQDQHASIFIKDYTVARRVLMGGIIGFYKSYQADEWDSPDLAQALYVLARNADDIQSTLLAHPAIRWANKLAHAMNRNTKSGSKKNIMAHYDLGNSFYEKWLDPSMTYSSAFFDGSDGSLTDAQHKKYASLAGRISLQESDSVLEIGSGWGGFAEYAAKEVGASVTGLTISPAQYDYARERMYRLGLNEKVQIRLQDYRDVEDTYDKVASIEMFEAVGQEYWPAYFSKINDCLVSGGKAGLQIITIADRFFDNYVRSTDFIQRYVFPGGMLPSPSVFGKHVEEAGLTLSSTLSFGQDYARTLSSWHDSFLNAWQDLQPMGFDQHFKKLWQFYLAYCEAGFRAETTDVKQVTLVKA
ncbi:MAG: cyclopropane-fatty-acyl-phospholipid synthase family protein [Aquisalinus sp.]|nr:cyclopropane-fatty-acyl-phospholipid synthase family protein [Aquisalinus sp.]